MNDNDKYFRLPNEIRYEGMLLNAELIRPATISKLQEFDTTDKDIIIAGFPKSGTTWLNEIVYLLQVEDRVVASKTPGNRKIVLDFLEDVTLAKDGFGQKRIMKTHLPARFISNQIEDGKAKVIVVMRNPKDMLVSYFHFYRMNSNLGNFDGSWDEFFELFKHKGLMYGDWLQFNQSYWQYRTRDNIMFIAYENVKKDTKYYIQQLASFLNIPCTQEDVDTISHFVDFRYMKENKATNQKDIAVYSKKMDFLRVGTMGGWKEVFTMEQSEYVDSLYQDILSAPGNTIIYT